MTYINIIFNLLKLPGLRNNIISIKIQNFLSFKLFPKKRMKTSLARSSIKTTKF